MSHFRSIFVIAIISLLAGCSGLTIDSAPKPYNEIVQRHETTKKPVAIDSVIVSLDGTQINANPAFVTRFSGALRDADLFSAVYEPSNVHEAPQDCYRLRLDVDEAIDPNMGSNLLKGVFIGLTFFILTPALPIRIDKQTAMKCELAHPDGAVSNYEASTKAHYYFTLFSNAAQVSAELDNTTINKSIEGLVARMRENRSL